MHREHHDHVTATQARRLRKQLTPSELTLWAELRNKKLGVRFRRQEPIGPYIVDFVCLAKRLVVELDGVHHEDSWYDEDRDSVLRRRGFQVLRFSNEDVVFGLEQVVAEIKAGLEA